MQTTDETRPDQLSEQINSRLILVTLRRASRPSNESYPFLPYLDILQEIKRLLQSGCMFCPQCSCKNVYLRCCFLWCTVRHFPCNSRRLCLCLVGLPFWVFHWVPETSRPREMARQRCISPSVTQTGWIMNQALALGKDESGNYSHWRRQSPCFHQAALRDNIHKPHPLSSLRVVLAKMYLCATTRC